MIIKIKINKGYKEINTPTLETGVCRGCGKDILWVVSENGKPMPISRLGNGDLVSHFFDCPEANNFRNNNKKNVRNIEKPSGINFAGISGGKK